MGAFGDWAQNYYDSGLSVLPVHPEKKSCFVEKWPEKFSKNFPTHKEQMFYVEHFKNHEIGLACGVASKVVAIDFDYVQMGDSEFIENLIIGALPITQVIKKGAKGWTRFYHYDDSVVNRGIDRMGVRMVDVLSTGRLTVLPPSKHKAGVNYQWIGGVDLLNADQQDMERITHIHIKQLEEISEYGQDLVKKFIKKGSRHDQVIGFILRYSDQAHDLEDLVQETLQADTRLNGKDPKGPYFKDKKYLSGQTSYEACKILCERVVGWKIRKRQDQGINWDIGKYPRLHAEGKKASINYEDFRSFFEHHFPDVRYDKIRRTTYYYSERTKNYQPIDNIKEVIESLASEVGLSPNYVNRHLQRWTGELKPTLCIDVPRFKGEDVISEMVACFKITNIEKDYVTELFKEWGANIFRRLFDKHKREQNKMIILKGGQGIGKDSWINYMFGSFGNYFSEIEIQDRKIENYQTISDLLVANIPEFDETHRVSLSTLKSLITSPGATFRAAYARKSDYVPFYVSYISSCNFDHILRDSSGNRRFMIFEVEDILWKYDTIDQSQILAQFYHLYQSGFKASRKAHMAMSAYVSGQTPDDVDQLILEDFNHVITQAINSLPVGVREIRKGENEGDPYVLWPEISADITRISKTYSVSLRRIQSVMRINGAQKRTKNERRYVSPVIGHPICHT